MTSKMVNSIFKFDTDCQKLRGSPLADLVRYLVFPCLIFLNSAVLAAPQIQTWQTENGAKVLFVPANEIPMLDIRLVFDAGAARDDGLSGLAVLTNGLLAEGAAGKSSQQIAEAFESVGAQIENSALRDMAILGVRSLTESRYLGTAIKTLSEVLTQPDFPQVAYQRELNRMKVSVKARQQSPSALASEAFNKAVFGDHPYALPVTGTEQSLGSMTLDEVRAFYKKYYVAKNATVVLVGNVERWQAEEIVKAIISNLPAGDRAAPSAACESQ